MSINIHVNYRPCSPIITKQIESEKRKNIIRWFHGILLCTMLQKLSKCEVKAWLCWNFIIQPHLRFYVKWNFGAFKRSKNVIFGNSRDSDLWILINLWPASCSNLLKSKFRTSKIVRNDIFGPFECTKIWFHVKSERQLKDQISTKSSLYFTFWKFLEHSAI